MPARKTSGLMLGPLTPIPSLEGLSQAQRVDAMVEWFGQNFEDPSEHTPRDDGEFVFVWGGPHDARDEISNAFGGLVNENEIEEAVDRLEGEALDWAPNENRLVDEDDDGGLYQEDGENLVVWEETTIPPEAIDKAEAVRRGLTQLEDIVRQWRRERPQIGHNRPPGPIDDDEADKVIDDIETGIATTRVELDKPIPNTAILRANEIKFRRLQETITGWLKSAALGGSALVGAYIGEKFLDLVWEKLGTVSEAISAWIVVLPGF